MIGATVEMAATPPLWFAQPKSQNGVTAAGLHITGDPLLESHFVLLGGAALAAGSWGYGPA